VVRYLPWDPNWVYYGELMQPARPLNTAQNAKRFNHPKEAPMKTETVLHGRVL